MTLVEVVGGLALLATLLVALLLAKARYTRQAAQAERRLQAVAAADALLATWQRDPRAIPRTGGSGALAGEAGLSWRAQGITNAVASELGAAVVRLEIVDDRPDAAADAVLTSIDFLVDPQGGIAPPIANPQSAKQSSKTGDRKKATPPPLKLKNAKSLHNP